jgi:drug/metabolite transporter (DMT)-like permease
MHGSSNPLLGIIQKVLSVLLVVAMLAMIKAAGDIPLGQVMFFRSVFATVPIVFYLASKRRLAGAMQTAHPLSHIARGIVSLGAMGFTFYALHNLPLPETITLQYTQPLMVVIFSALFLGEPVRMVRWTAVIVGLCGVLIITWPSLSVLSASSSGVSLAQAQGVVSAILAACCSAWVVLLIRKLVDTERSTTIMLWFGATASILLLFTVPFGWVKLSTGQTLLLLASGISGGLGQLLIAESVRHAPVSTIAPFEYTSIIFGTLLGYLFFGEVPGLNIFVGGSIVIAAGLLIIWREGGRKPRGHGS